MFVGVAKVECLFASESLLGEYGLEAEIPDVMWVPYVLT
jgi:hypothetical protein